MSKIWVHTHTNINKHTTKKSLLFPVQYIQAWCLHYKANFKKGKQYFIHTPLEDINSVTHLVVKGGGGRDGHIHCKPGPDNNSYLIQESWIQVSWVKYASQEARIYFSVSSLFMTWMHHRWSIFNSPEPCSASSSQTGVVIRTGFTVYGIKAKSF